MSIIVVCSEYAEAVQTLSNAVAQLRFVQAQYQELITDLESSAIMSRDTRASFDGLKSQADVALSSTLKTLDGLSDAVGSFVTDITEIDTLRI